MKLFRAGCGRERPGPDDLSEWAYTALEYPECPTCRHRLEPEEAPSFCRWLDPVQQRAQSQRFAVLANFEVPE